MTELDTLIVVPYFKPVYDAKAMRKDGIFPCPLYKELRWPGENGRQEGIRQNFVDFIDLSIDCSQSDMEDRGVMLVCNQHRVFEFEP